MLEVTLMKSLYHEMDPKTIKEVREFDHEGASKYRELAIEVADYPQIQTITSEVRYMAYGSALYYIHFNGDLTVDEEITNDMVKSAILTFFKKYKPEYLLEELPLEGSVLDCFDADKIPDYRPKYAFPGLIMYEDIKNGTYEDPRGNKPTFPGLRMLAGNVEEKKDDRPVNVSNDAEFTKFDGNKDDFQKKMEELKAQFDISSILG